MIRAYFITAPLIILATVVLGTFSLIGSLIDRAGRIPHRCARFWAAFIVTVSGVRVRIQGIERFRPEGRYIICPNHQSHMDIPVLLVAFPVPLRFTAKKELFRVPFLGWHLRLAGHFPIDREHPRAAIRSLGRAVTRIGEGLPVVIFPEGGTSPDGRIGAFKRGAFVIAARSGAEVLPVTIAGTRETLTPGTRRVSGGDVVVTIHPPLASNVTSPGELATRTREMIVDRFLQRGISPEAGQVAANSL